MRYRIKNCNGCYFKDECGGKFRCKYYYPQNKIDEEVEETKQYMRDLKMRGAEYNALVDEQNS